MAQKGITLRELFEKRNLSRRTFLKTCLALTSLLGLAPEMLAQVEAAAGRKALLPLVWLHGHECTGCDEALLRSGTPLASDVILNMISLEYMDVLAAAAGEPLEEHLKKLLQNEKGRYILAVEGAVPLADAGVYCMVGGKTFLENLREAAAGAALILEVGSCAAWGGIQAARPNPTNSVSVSDVIKGKTIVKLPGCPPIPEVLTGVIMHYTLFGKLPPLDAKGRPKQFYGNRIHDTCYRRPFFDAGLFVEKFDDPGSKAGWCLYKVGCRAPETYNSCGNMRWWNGLSYPIQSGAPCVGCSSNNFWDQDGFYTRLPDIPLPGTVVNADRLGAAAAGLITAGVAAHAVASAVQHKKLKQQKAESDEQSDDKGEAE